MRVPTLVKYAQRSDVLGCSWLPTAKKRAQNHSLDPQFAPPSYPPPAPHLLHHVPSPTPTLPSTLICPLRPHIHQVTTNSLLPHSHGLLI